METNKSMTSRSNYDERGNATHYDDQRINMIHIFERVWGTRAVMTYCEITALKYRIRMGKKDNLEQELIKAEWYQRMASYLLGKVDTEEEIFSQGEGRQPLPKKFLDL